MTTHGAKNRCSKDTRHSLNAKSKVERQSHKRSRRKEEVAHRLTQQ